VSQNQMTDFGEKNVSAKLTEQEVREIRAKHKTGLRISDIAKEYGVTWGCVKGIVTGRRWGHLK